MKVLDLFCGLGGFSRAFLQRGHDVIGIDVVPPADILADVRALPLDEDYRPDVVLGSPPCTEFTKWDMPWHQDDTPTMELVHAFLAVVEKLRPRWWVMENVRGLARRWERRPAMRCGSRYLWGDFPLFLIASHKQAEGKWRLSPSPERSRIRAKIPKVISEGLCRSMEALLFSMPSATREQGVKR